LAAIGLIRGERFGDGLGEPFDGEAIFSNEDD
jgi:hypothetical protein